LVKIEEGFRILKTDLEGRPVYVWREDRIQGHFLICFIALIIVRLIQKTTNYKYSASCIQKALNSASCREIKNKIYYLSSQTKEFSEIVKFYDIDFNHNFAKYETLKKMF
jgi:transposase